MRSRMLRTLLGVLVLAPLSVSALTADEIREQINTLLRQIAALEAQLVGQGSVSNTSTLSYCPNLTVTLLQGQRDATTNGEVSDLQRFLAAYYKLDAVSIVTGYFGPLTEVRVRQFQGEKGISQTGIVGPLTRAAIRAACGNTVVTAAQTSGNSCVFNGNNIPHGSAVTAYERSAVSGSSLCRSEARLCENGILRGTYQYPSCATDVSSGASCIFSSQTVAHGSVVLAYAAQSVGAGQTCAAELRTCTNGTLSGSYQYSSCTSPTTSTTIPVANNTATSTGSSAATCTWNGQSYADGQTVSGSGTLYTCQDGVWVGKGFVAYATYVGVETGNSNPGNNFAYTRFGLTPRRGKAPLGVTAYAYVAHGMAMCGIHTITWGDGSVDVYPRSNSGTSNCVTPESSVKTYTHTYMSPGTYTVTFTQESTSVPVSATVRVE